jgi:hypothetical protein
MRILKAFLQMLLLLLPMKQHRHLEQLEMQEGF